MASRRFEASAFVPPSVWVYHVVVDLKARSFNIRLHSARD